MADINLSVDIAITITENADKNLDVLNKSLYDSIAIVENLAKNLDVLVPYIYESIAIIEVANVFDLGIELVAWEYLFIAEVDTIDLEDFADFPRTYPFTEEISYDVLVSEFEKLYEQRRLKSTDNRLAFTINMYPLTKLESDVILDFYKRSFGRAHTFKFTSPLDSVAYRVRFADSSFKRERVAFNTFRIQVTLMKVL
jgi:hypothetical protein